MAETSTPDIAEPKRAYEEGLQAYLKSQLQPQSFLEHPATRMIPILGPILEAFGRVGQQKRHNQAVQQSSLFQTLVKGGDLDENTIQLVPGIPMPILQSGILESQKVRETLGYQARKNFSAFIRSPEYTQPFETSLDLQKAPPGTPFIQGSTPSEYKREKTQLQPEMKAEAFQNWLRQYPEFAAALGVPEAGRIAMEAETQDIVRPYIARALGQPVSGRGRIAQRQTQQVTTPQLQTIPPVFTGFPEETAQRLTQTYQDYAQGKIKDPQLEKSLSTIPGLPPDSLPQFAEGFRTHAQSGKTPSVDPLRGFNPAGPGQAGQVDISLSGGKAGVNIKGQTLQERASAYVLHHTLQNPNNYLTAIRDIASKGITLPPEVEKSIGERTVLPMFRHFTQDAINRGVGNPNTAEGRYAIARYALERTDDAQGRAISPETRTSLQDPAVVAGMVAQMTERGRLQPQIGEGSPGGQLRREQTHEQLYATTVKQGAAASKLFTIIDRLKDLYKETNPEQKDSIVAALQGFLKRSTNFAGLQPKTREFLDAVTAYAGIMGTLAQDAGSKTSDVDIVRYMREINVQGLTGRTADERFDALKRSLGQEYFTMRDVLKGKSLPLDKEYEEWSGGTKKKSIRDEILEGQEGR